MTLEARAVLQTLLDTSDKDREEYGREGYYLLTMYLTQVGIKGETVKLALLNRKIKLVNGPEATKGNA